MHFAYGKDSVLIGSAKVTKVAIMATATPRTAIAITITITTAMDIAVVHVVVVTVLADHGLFLLFSCCP